MIQSPLSGPAQHPHSRSTDAGARRDARRDTRPGAGPDARRPSLTGRLRQALPYVMATALVWYLTTHLADLDITAVRAAFASVAPGQWLVAALATAVSFWAVGRYDGVVQRRLGLQVAPAAARRAGIAAIAISQTIGLGLITGALVRWRMLPGLTLWQATRLSLTVALSFLAGWAVVAALVTAVLPPLPALRPAGVAVLALTGLGLAFCLWRPSLQGWLINPLNRLLSHPTATLRLPPIATLARILTLAAVDSGAAALAFVVLLPEAANLSPLTVLPAFLLALGAGLISGTPGGVGPFEVTLLLLLPTADPSHLMATVLAYRLVYYAIPAVLAGLLLMAGPARPHPYRSRTAAPQPALTPDTGPTSARLTTARPTTARLNTARRAEFRLAGQSGLTLWSGPDGGNAWLAAETGQSLVSLGDPLTGGDDAAMIAALHRAARARDLIACHYKCSARVAALARRAGHAVLAIAHEAVLTPADFSLDSPARSALRRKLRKADRAGAHVSAPPAGSPLPLHDLARIADAWATARGGERGFSMGRFDPATLAGQRLYLAWAQGQPVAFLSLHQTSGEWALDLMRHIPAMPDGTMQALLVRAIADAAALGIPRLSLAAVPLAARGRGPAAALCRLLDHCSGASGLRQFKSGFAPDWQPLYIAAPTWPGLMIAGLDVARAIAFPPAVPGHSPTPRPCPPLPAQSPARASAHDSGAPPS